MSATTAETALVSLPELARLDLRTSRSGDTATASLQRALGLQFRYQPARLALARSLALPNDPPPVDNLDGRAIRGETLFGAGAEELGLWAALLTTRSPSSWHSRRALQEMVAAHWARGAGLLWDGLRDAEDAPSAFSALLLRSRR